MALNLADRLLTIAVTATLTSAAWIVIGSGYLDRPTPAGDAEAAAPSIDQSGLGASAGEGEALLIPVEGVQPDRLTDTFLDDRGGRAHEAIDIMAPAGSTVIAAAPGRVEKLFRSDAGGNTVYVRSDDRRTLYYYAHLRDYAPGLAEGQSIARGEPLGTVGSSGNADATAPHLHFAVLRTAPDAEWWEPATAVNPYGLLIGG